MNIKYFLLHYGTSIITIIGLSGCQKEALEVKDKNPNNQTTENMIKLEKEHGRKYGISFDDMAVDIRVKTALHLRPDLKHLDIDVLTTEFMTTLSGQVDTQNNRNEAQDTASKVEGSKWIDNQLVVVVPF